MSRYIDADRFKDTLERASEKMHLICGVKGVDIGAVIKAVDMFVTADVVEVVRCKDCKFWGIPHANDVEKSHYCCRDNMWCMPLRFADDFCSYGERRANDAGG